MMVDSGKEKKIVALVDGWEAKAHHHAGLDVAAAGVGEGWVRERVRDMPGPKGNCVVT